MGVIASAFGLGATFSNYIGQMVVEKFGHVASLTAAFFISLVPVVLFLFMPETLGARDHYKEVNASPKKNKAYYQSLSLSPADTESSSSSVPSPYGSFD